MGYKIRSAILFVLFSLFSIGQANANFIVGDLYTDSDSATSGVFWQFVGRFDIADGPSFSDEGALALNGIEAATAVFGELSEGEYALSTDEENLTVDHLAIYDSYNNALGIFANSESLNANLAGTLNYDAIGDVSAYISDRSPTGENFNNVFRSIAIQVPEPSTLIFLSIILFIFSKRYIKNK